MSLQVIKFNNSVKAFPSELHNQGLICLSTFSENVFLLFCAEDQMPSKFHVLHIQGLFDNSDLPCVSVQMP